MGEVARLDSGRNATDIELTVAAMDLLHEGKTAIFCIVSSDADYAALALRIRQAGKTVIGLGKERESAVRFREACTAFEVLEEPGAGEGGAGPEADSAPGAELLEHVKRAMGEEAREWTKVSVLGMRLKRCSGGIDYRRFGKSKLVAVLELYPEYFETRGAQGREEFRLVAR